MSEVVDRLIAAERRHAALSAVRHGETLRDYASRSEPRIAAFRDVVVARNDLVGLAFAREPFRNKSLTARPAESDGPFSAKP